MKMKKGDQVKIIAGKDKGKQGDILQVFPSRNKAIVDKLNVIKKAQKPKRQGEKGQLVNVSMPIDVSNLQIVCPSCSKAVRVGYKFDGGSKYRFCKKCNEKF